MLKERNLFFSLPVCWENLSYLRFIFLFLSGHFFFEYGHQHLATLEDISMPSLVTRVIPL